MKMTSKLKIKILIFSIVSTSSVAMASCDAVENGLCHCHDLLITNIKADNDNIRVLYERRDGNSGGWHLLAPFTHPSANPKLAIALAAKSTGVKVEMSFPIGADCDIGSNIQSNTITIQNN